MACYAPVRFSTHFPGANNRYNQQHAAAVANSFFGELSPFFRALDSAFEAPQAKSTPKFRPRFDVREEADSFQLSGELPGVEQKDVAIEFVDQNTIQIKGRTVREFTNTNTEDKAQESQVNTPTSDTASETGSNYRKPSVEDEDFVEVDNEKSAPATETTETAPTPKPEDASNKPKYWVSERSVGEFTRQFTFNGQIDQDGVSASLKNGILNITVPKIAPKQRKINIE